jgi:hypothetical protein
MISYILLTNRIEAIRVWLRNLHLKDGSWFVKSKEKRTLEVQQMGFTRPTVRYTLRGHIRSERVSVADSVKDIEKHRRQWGAHVQIESNRLPKRTTQYAPW